MKGFAWVIVAALAVAPSGRAQPAPGGGSAVLASIDGEVTVRKGLGDWQIASGGESLGTDHEIGTGVDSKATIQFADGSLMQLAELTEVRLANLLDEGGRRQVKVQLKLGEVKAQVKPQETITTDFSVSTPTATASVRGTEIQEISHHPARGTRTRLASGKLRVESSRGRVDSSGEDEVRVDEDGDVLTPRGVVAEEARIHVEPAGLTEPEREQIAAANQPQSFTPRGTKDASRTSPGGTLIFRFVLQ